MNPQDHVEPVRHHITLVSTDPRWTVENLAEYVAEILSDHEYDGESITVEVFDESHELVELRRTRDDAFRVIGTGAIHLLKQGDGWERLRELMQLLRMFIEEGKYFESKASSKEYLDGEEDGYASAVQRVERILDNFEKK